MDSLIMPRFNQQVFKPEVIVEKPGRTDKYAELTF
jgi:hypothetical protein